MYMIIKGQKKLSNDCDKGKKKSEKLPKEK